MPIANCLVTQSCFKNIDASVDPILLWSKESTKSAEQMTINLTTIEKQLGSPYAAMVTLQLPSLWTRTDISLLQVGLVKALAKYFDISPEEIHIVTQIIHSGHVVEKSNEIVW